MSATQKITLDAAVKAVVKQIGISREEALHLIGLKAGNLRTTGKASYTVSSSKGGITVDAESDPNLSHLWDELLLACSALSYVPGKLATATAGRKNLAAGLNGIKPLKVREEAKPAEVVGPVQKP
jgi:hypothetical protein